MAAPGSDLLRRAWDQSADGYAAYFGPRFRPWLDDLVRATVEAAASAPDGPVLVPCCGPGEEVEALARALPDRRIVGVDLSARMVELTRARTASFDNVEAHAADATHPPEGSARPALIASAFGLQQMPAPPDAAAAWTRALLPGGTAHVVFWPAACDAALPDTSEPDGPFSVSHRIVLRVLELPAAEWEPELVPAIEAAGGTVVSDELIAHEIAHDSAEAMWTHMNESGPWRALSLRYGSEALERVRREFLDAMPPGPLCHSPRARSLRFTNG